MRLIVSDDVKTKLLNRHKVRIEEIEQCFVNVERTFLEDTRLEHRTEPVTEWFIAETDAGRRLKVCFMQLPDGAVKIKTAYKPDPVEEKLYERHAKRI